MTEPYATAMSARERPASGDERAARAGELVLLLGISALGAWLRMSGSAELPWAIEETAAAWDGRAPLAARTTALAAGVATIPLGYALLRSAGRAPAFALALLLATSPWHVHASRLATATSVAFLGALILARWVRIGRSRGARGLPESRIGMVLLAAAALALLAPPGARGAPGAAGRPDASELLFGEIGLALPLLVALHFGRPDRWGELLDAALLGFAGALVAMKWGAGTGALAWLLAPLFLGAGRELGRWIAAAGSGRSRLAIALLAVVPVLPAVASEQMDAGRFDLEPIARAFARERRGGETLFASDPPLASRALGVEARPLAELSRAPAAGDRPDFVLLLLERGRVRGAALPAELEARLELVARTAAKRLDLRRYEARLYRRSPEPSP